MLDDLSASDILEIIKFFHQDNPIIRSKAFICKDYKQVIIGVNMSKHICENCKQEFDWPPSAADTWTCPTCGHKNTIADATMQDEAMDGLCQYDGPGHDLPTGGYCKIPDWFPEVALAKAWLVADPESDEGTKLKKRAELIKEDTILGVVINRKTLAATIAGNGADFFKIRDANGGPLMTLKQWALKYPTGDASQDEIQGIALVAIRNMRRYLKGPGVRF